MNKEKIVSAFKIFNSYSDDYLGAFYINIFGGFPRAYRIYFDKITNKLTYNCSSSEFDRNKNIGKHIDDRQLLEKFLQIESEHIIVFCYSYHEWMIIYDDNETSFLINVTMSDEQTSDLYLVVYTNNIQNAFNIIKPNIFTIKKHKTTEFGIAAVDQSNALYTSWYDYTNHEINIKQNYNDDIPYDQMCQLLKSSDKPELMLLYGEPGTGKTSLIKHFISKYPEKNFVFMDGTLLANIPQQNLMGYFLENQNTIFILEDCEKVLMNREHYANPVMPVLLNLTDGIIGDVLGIKLICTFNTSLNNIDKALIRKGRLSLKYEFKKLSKDKVKNIIGEEKEMTLADMYHINRENDYSKRQKNKIGFGA